MKRYSKIGQAIIQPRIPDGKSAFEMAKSDYKKNFNRNFNRDLLHYLKTGFVVVRPWLFAMGNEIERDGRRGWFIQMAVGNILELLTLLPYRLDFLAFRRSGNENMRIVDLDSFINKVVKLCGNQNAG